MVGEAEEKESTESSLHTCGSWRNEERRSQGMSAVRQEVSRVGRVLEEDRVGDIPRGRVA